MHWIIPVSNGCGLNMIHFLHFKEWYYVMKVMRKAVVSKLEIVIVGICDRKDLSSSSAHFNLGLCENICDPRWWESWQQATRDIPWHPCGFGTSTSLGTLMHSSSASYLSKKSSRVQGFLKATVFSLLTLCAVADCLSSQQL